MIYDYTTVTPGGHLSAFGHAEVEPAAAATAFQSTLDAAAEHLASDSDDAHAHELAGNAQSTPGMSFLQRLQLTSAELFVLHARSQPLLRAISLEADFWEQRRQKSSAQHF